MELLGFEEESRGHGAGPSLVNRTLLKREPVLAEDAIMFQHKRLDAG